MSFVGKLEEFQLSDLLQIISTNEKSGKLNLTRHDAQGVIVFRQGKIIYAANSSARETLGFLLLTADLITEQQLLEALEIQHQADEEKRLGSILVETGALPSEALERVVRTQLEKVLNEFMDWDKGFFKFERLDLPDRGEIGVDAEDFILPEGLRADQVLVDISSAIETRSKESPPPLEPLREESTYPLSSRSCPRSARPSSRERRPYGYSSSRAPCSRAAFSSSFSKATSPACISSASAKRAPPTPPRSCAA